RISASRFHVALIQDLSRWARQSRTDFQTPLFLTIIRERHYPTWGRRPTGGPAPQRAAVGWRAGAVILVPSPGRVGQGSCRFCRTLLHWPTRRPADDARRLPAGRKSVKADMDDHTEARQEPTRAPEPGTDKLVLYEGRRRALAEIMAGMDADAKWVLLLGPEGIGKSSILKRLLTELRLTDADTVLCDGVKASEADSLATALRGQLRLPEPTRRRLGPAHV